jgi:hypothetical protein
MGDSPKNHEVTMDFNNKSWSNDLDDLAIPPFQETLYYTHVKKTMVINWSKPVQITC